MTAQEEKKRVDELRKKIPRERFLWEEQATPSQRHKRRAEEAKDPAIKAFHISAAEQQEILERELERQLGKLQTQRNQETAADEDTLLSKALALGPTRFAKFAWQTSNALAHAKKIGWTGSKNTLKIAFSPIAFLFRSLFTYAGTVWVIAMALGFFAICYQSVHFHLIDQLFASILIGFVPLGLGIFAFHDRDITEDLDKGAAAVVFSFATLLVIVYLSGIFFWKTFSPDNMCVNVVTRNNQIVRVIDGKDQWFIEPPNIRTDTMYTYFKGGKVEWKELPIPDKPIRVIANGQKGTVYVTATTVLKTDVVSHLANPAKNPKEYRYEIKHKVTELLLEVRKKFDKGEATDLQDLAKQINNNISNDAYVIRDTTITFTPDPAATPTPMVIKE